jgi:hypothetical protein
MAVLIFDFYYNTAGVGDADQIGNAQDPTEQIQMLFDDADAPIEQGDSFELNFAGTAAYTCTFEGIAPDGAIAFTVTAFQDSNTFYTVGSTGLISDTDYGNPATTNGDVGINPGASVCFAAGTRIATPKGERTVEALVIGDPILTADGRTVPVKWIGRQTVHKLFTPPERFAPVRVAAGALGDGLPRRDLVLTADHALLVGGILANASALVNAATITRVAGAELPDRVTYYHVETEAHEMILAEGAPAETFVDHQSRRLFDNYAEYVALYGEERRSIPESDLPRVTSPRQLPAALKSRLAPAMSA